MKKKTGACIAACLAIIISTSCNKETELTLSPVMQSSTAGLSQAAGKHFIGEHFGGGIIFYLDKTGRHGLIATSADFEEPATWSRKDTLNGAKDTALGAGAANSVKIYNIQGYPEFETDSYAALECLELNINGYQDWYLPSLNELNKMYQSKDILGGFQPFSYWSSSEFNRTKAWYVNFGNGSQALQIKTASYSLRPARKF